jgi:2'-5' RNA ligase
VALRRRLFVAVVVDGDAGATIDALRLALRSPELDRIAPHVTLVAPTNVAEAELDDVLAGVRGVAHRSRPFSIEVGPVATFPRDRPVLYAAVTDPDGGLETISSALRAEALRPAARDDRFSFVPHVTLHNRTDPGVAIGATAAFSGFRIDVVVEALTVLERAATGGDGRWVPIAEYRLGPPVVRGRGGIEIELEESRVADPVTRALLGPAPGLEGRSLDRWVITARIGDVVVGAAEGESSPLVTVLCSLVVDRPHRRTGIGSRILELVESFGAPLVVADGADAETAHLLTRRGYVEAPGPPVGRRRFLRRFDRDLSGG